MPARDLLGSPPSEFFGDCRGGAQAAGLDRQTDAASGAYCLLQPPAGRPLYSKKLTSLTIGDGVAGYPPAQAMPEAGPEKPAHAKGGVDNDAEPPAAGTQAGSRTS